MNHMKACKGSKLSIQQRIANYLLTYRSTRHATTGRTPPDLFLGRELRIRLTVLRPSVWEKVMDSQAKQKGTHDALSKLREFYLSDRVLVKEHRKKHTWWPCSIAARSGLKYYVAVLNQWSNLEATSDHIRRDTMDNGVSTGIDKESRNTVQDPVEQGTFGAGIPLPEKLPMNTPVMQPVDSETSIHLENESTS